MDTWACTSAYVQIMLRRGVKGAPKDLDLQQVLVPEAGVSTRLCCGWSCTCTA